MQRIKLFYKKTLLARAKVYNTPFLKAKGLMFRKPLKKGEGIILASNKENLTSIHMLFVFFPIDAVWLDKQKKIIHIARNIPPFTPLITAPKPAQYIVELPPGTTKQMKLNQKVQLKGDH